MQRRIEVARRRKSEERVKALKATARRVNALLDRMSKTLAWRTGGFSVVFPTSREDFVKEGQRMHNCIGGYFAACADGERACFFVNRGGKRVADVEVSPSSGKVLQCYARGNVRTDKETEAFAALVGKQVASALRRGKRKAA